NIILLQAASPVMVSLGARFYLGERLHRMQWLGVVVSASGVLLVITNGRLLRLRPEDVHTGDLVNLVTLAGWRAFTVYSKRVLASDTPAMVTPGARGPAPARADRVLATDGWRMRSRRRRPDDTSAYPPVNEGSGGDGRLARPRARLS